MTEYNNQQQHLQNDENENGSGLTLHDLLQMVLANWYWFALSVLICLGMAYYYLASTLTIYGIRTDVAVAREVNGVRTIEYLDLTSKDLFNSPAFYIQQNDVIYVKPNKYKAQAGEISQNRNFYLSLVGTAISVATLIITLTK